MKTYTLQVELLSPALIGAGEGFGALIDLDVMFDELGVPWIPAKRIKGGLRDAALDVCDMFRAADVPAAFHPDPDFVFGVSGAAASAPVYFGNLTMPAYGENKPWLSYYLHHPDYQGLVSTSKILNTFTALRQQTMIDDERGVAEDHSLRTSRVVRAGLRFVGEVISSTDTPVVLETLLLACANFRQLGTRRNRGFGNIRCVLLDEAQEELPLPNRIKEVLCTH